jgi:azurin
MRMTLEKVKGKYQGACYPFREGFASGLIRLRFGVDGSLFGGMTSRGWASTGKELYALQRLEWTGKIPFEMKAISAQPDGFEIEFTQAVNRKLAKNAATYEVTGFTYRYHHHYGSEIINSKKAMLKGIQISEDGIKVRLVLDSLREGYIHEIKLHDLFAANGLNLLHNTAYYTLNNIPDGGKALLAKDEQVTMHRHMTAGTMDKKEEAPKAAATAPMAKRVTRMPAGWKQPDQVIVLGTRPGLKYSVDRLQVKAGSKIKLVFNNNDDMTHNVVLVLPGAAKEVGDLAFNMGLKGAELDYIPKTQKVLYHTKLLQPNASEAIYFIAPTKPGTYTYLCSYPGHAMIMQGTMVVSK